MFKYYKKFVNIFNKVVKDILSLYKENLNHVINFKFNTTLFFDFLYNLSKKELIMLKNYINKNLTSDFINRFKFLVETLILFVKKFDDSLRLCVNYLNLNAIFIKNKYFISLINEIFDRLKKTKRFIKLNLRNVYNLIRIKKNDE